MKAIIGVYGSVSSHWVGDGFPVKSLFFYDQLGEQISPFLLLDHAGPAQFAPTTKKRGVGVHPHRGFETVTIVYDGEVAHGDSVGNRGVIGAGWHLTYGAVMGQFTCTSKNVSTSLSSYYEYRYSASDLA